MNPGKPSDYKYEVLVLVPAVTPRISYVFEFLSGNNGLLLFSPTADAAVYSNFNGLKLNYTGVKEEGICCITPHAVMLNEGIVPVAFDLDFFRERMHADRSLSPILNPDRDVVAFIFYLVSRYEEYLPHIKDNHGRFHHTASVLWQLNALHFPFADELAVQLYATLLPEEIVLEHIKRGYRFEHTLDIDQAYQSRGKGFFRNAGGFLKNVVKGDWPAVWGRMQAIFRKDFFDTHAFIHTIHEQYHFRQKVFFLVGRHSGFDPGLPAGSAHIKKLIQQYMARCEVGLHPSYLSSKQEELIAQEKNVLESITGKPVTASRQHFLRFALPDTYRALEAAGIQQEYAMGYAGFNGFRAGTCKPFTWFNLATNQKRTLRVFPLSCMDGTLLESCGNNMDQMLEDAKQRADACARYGGIFISLFHNHLLTDDAVGKRWRILYEALIRYAIEKEN